jgi:hypothetical protein
VTFLSVADPSAQVTFKSPARPRFFMGRYLVGPILQ